MKILRPAPPVFRALLALLFLVACASVPAQAQTSGWQFDHFECTGSTQWTPGSTTQTFPWPASQAGSPEIQFGLNQYGAPCQSVGTICAVFTWQGSGPPSDSLPVLISSSAGVYGTPPQPDPDDGFQDPLIPSGTPASKTSEGSHVVKLSNSGGSTTLKTDVYSLSAICGPSDNAAGSGTSIDFQVHLANASLEGHSTADTVGWDASAPRFFSGTACTAKGVAAALSGNVAHAQLCIGENGSDTVVNEYFDGSASGGTSASSVPLNAMFDSTHFKDGAKIKLTLKVWDTNGGHYEVDITGPAYNKASVLTNHTVGYLFFILEALEVKNTLQGINYSAHSDSFDNRQTILDTMPQYTSFLITSHANDAGFGDCYDNSQGTLISYSDVAAAVAKKSKYQPPYNFAFVDGCHSAGHPNEESTGGPEGFGILPANSSNLYSANDRAFLGWRNFVWSTTNVSWTTDVYQQLAQSHTLYDAVVEATANCEPIGGDEATELLPIYIPAVILGDPSMTLHGVYQNLTSTGSDSHNSDWFRPL